MEIDLFCTDLKLAIEIDGPQHLAEDLGKHLDATLDSILRAIVHLRRTR